MTERRVLHFLWSGMVGGAERAVYQLVRSFANGVEEDVGVAFGRAEGPYADAIKSLGCEVIDLQMRGGADLVRAFAGRGRMRPYDLHHFHVLEPSIMRASTRCRGTTRVFTQRHGRHQGTETLAKAVRRTVAGRLLREHFQAVSGNTQHATRYAVERYRLQHLPSQVTYNGIDFSLLTPCRNREAVRCDLGVQPSEIVVGSSGSFITLKRLDRLVPLLAHRSDIKLLLVGDGPLRGTLETQATALGARDRLLVTGQLEQIADHLQTVDIFVLPSTADESFGNALVEAMALGIPSVAFSDSPGLCEHIENGLTGFIVEDEDDLKSLVSRLAADRTLRSRVGAAGAQHVRSKYRLENMRDAYRRLYESAVAFHATDHNVRDEL